MTRALFKSLLRCKISVKLQPAEKLWLLTKEGVTNELFESLDELEDTLVERCIELV
jgi:hypothetical protein